MTVNGIVQNGLIVLEGGVILPEGAWVEVVVKPAVTSESPLSEMLLRHAGKAEGLPEDMAAQHDHYLHGTPKR